MAKIGLVRHGLTDWNMAGRMQGRNDIPLNDSGRRQAVLLGNRMAGESWDMIYSSDMQRARETAEIIAHTSGIPLAGLSSALAERSFGLIEGTTEDERIARWGPKWRELDLGQEDRAEVVRRAGTYLDQLMGKHPDSNILVISHGAVIGSLVDAWFPELAWQHLSNTSVNVLTKVGGKWVCLLHNCTKHLKEQEG